MNYFRKQEETSQFVLWDQHYFDTKSNQGFKNISKSNLETYKKDTILWGLSQNTKLG